MITAVVIGVVALSALYTLRKLVTSPQLRADYLLTVRAIRWWMVPGAILNLTVVILVFNGLAWLAPWLWWGWWKLLGGSGNVWVGQTNNVGLGWQIMALAIPLALFLALPILAHYEEVAYRKGSEKQSVPARIGRQLRFGLMHSVFAGIPIAAGLALTLSGFYFERVYLKTLQRQPAAMTHEVEASTRHIVLRSWPNEEIGPQRAVAVAAAAHTVSNGIGVGTLLLVLIAKTMGWLR